MCSPQDILTWTKQQEWDLWVNFGFNTPKSDDVDANTCKNISEVGTYLHKKFDKGIHGKSPVVKFYNKRMPNKHNSELEILAHGKWEDKNATRGSGGYDSISSTTKALPVIRQDWIPTNDTGLYMYQPSHPKINVSAQEEYELVEGESKHWVEDEDEEGVERKTVDKITTYNLFPKFQPFKMVDAHNEYWSYIKSKKPTYYTADVPWSEVLKPGELPTTTSIGTRWWRLNNTDGNIFMHHEATQDYSGYGFSHLYFGRRHSTFSWHVEPADIPSVSVLHAGAPKLWYTIHESYLKALEEFLWPKISDRKNVHRCCNFFEHRWTLYDPVQLMRDMQRTVDSQFAITAIVQAPGIHVFVPKKTPHWGHSTGNNIGEALGVCTKRTAEYLRTNEPPACPYEAADDEEGESLELASAHTSSFVLDRPRVPARTPQQRFYRKPVSKLFRRFKGGRH